MKTNILGRTGLGVTQLGYGAMEMRLGPDDPDRGISEEQAGAMLNAVLDAGITFIDTAVDYGLSEERIGRHISSRRGEYYLATKCGCNPVDKGGKEDEERHIWSRDQFLWNIEGSLKRLNTDHVDILQMHNPRPVEEVTDEVVSALREIQAAGHTRFISISTTLPYLTEYLALGVFDTFQIPYSCLQPDHHDAITAVGEAGAGVIVRGGIGCGGPEATSLRRVNTELWEKARLEEVLDGMKPAELILRYTLKHPYCHTTIVGTRNPEHLKENLVFAAKGPLPDETYDEVKRRVAQAQAARESS